MSRYAFQRRPLADPEPITLRRIGIAPARPPGVKFVLYRRGDAKPQGFADFAAFLRFLHRRRAGRPLLITDGALSVSGRQRFDGFETLKGVTIHVLDAVDGEPQERIGFAWVNGQNAEALRAALRKAGQH